MFATLCAIVTLAVWSCGQDADEPDISITPNVILVGDPVRFTCIGHSMDNNFGIELWRNYTYLGGLVPGERIVAMKTNPLYGDSFLETTLYDESLSDRVTLTNGSTSLTLIVEYSTTNCKSDGYAYGCQELAQMTKYSRLQLLAIIDNSDPVFLSRPKHCFQDGAACAKCADDPSQPTRFIGEEVELTCRRNMSFPAGATNTFRWYKRSAGGPWEIMSSDTAKGDNPHVDTQGTCYPKEAKASSFKYELTNQDNLIVELKCEVELELSGGRKYNTNVTRTICVQVAVERGLVAFFSTGAGIAVVSIGVLVTVCGVIGGAVFWYYKRKSAETPDEDNDEEIYN